MREEQQQGEGVPVAEPTVACSAVSPLKTAEDAASPAHAPARKPINSDEIARAVVSFLNYRRYVIVPNVSWGVNLHECDLLAINGDHYATEIEIKISRSDLIADKKKPHHQRHHARIRRLMFAVPEAMNKASVLAHVPDHAGIIVVSHGWKDGVFDCKVVRRGELNPAAKPWGPTERFELARLGVMRFWTRRAGEPLPGLGDPLEMPTEQCYP